jgi:GTPase SAR1 family protein
MPVKSAYKFCDGTEAYRTFQKHDKGMVILGPPGCGKSTFVATQKGNDWTDQDELFEKLGANWKANEENQLDFTLNYMRCDYLLEQSKQLGYKVIGALFWKYVPDAIVMPDIEIHKRWIATRDDLCLETILDIRTVLVDISISNHIPLFESCEDAVEYVER